MNGNSVKLFLFSFSASAFSTESKAQMTPSVEENRRRIFSVHVLPSRWFEAIPYRMKNSKFKEYAWFDVLVSLNIRLWTQDTKVSTIKNSKHDKLAQHFECIQLRAVQVNTRANTKFTTIFSSLSTATEVRYLF